MPAVISRPHSTHARFRERVASTAARVDAANGIIRDVKVIGQHSSNGRHYTPEALRGAVGLYEGVRVFLNHPTPDQMNQDRQIEKWAGVLRNVRYREGALFGDLHLRKQAAMYAEIIEAAQEFPNSFGLSHCADGRSRMDDGTEVVESITEVFSVDIVCRPATTAGLFESIEHNAEQQEIISTLADSAETIRRTIELLFDKQAEPQFGDEISALQMLLASAHQWLCAPERIGTDSAVCEELKRTVDAIVAMLQSPTTDNAAASAETYLDALVDSLRDLADGGDGLPGHETIAAVDEVGWDNATLAERREYVRAVHGNTLTEGQVWSAAFRDTRPQR